MKYKTIPASTSLYFVTSTVASHKPLFVTEEVSTIVLDSLFWMRQNKRWKLYAFCLMPNHLHIVVKLLDNRPIEKVMGQFHSFTGHKIVEQLKLRNDSNIVHFLKHKGSDEGDREYMIWEDCLARNIETEYVLLETVEYVHNNPINKSWHLVDDRSDYRFSTARYYDLGEKPVIEIDDIEELLGGTPSR